MCGRYVLAKPRCRSAIEREYFQGLDRFPERYNVAPTQTMPIARLVDGKLEFTSARWGFPFSASDEITTFRTINARAETVATKPIFRAAYESRRCLVPASGYYEWQTRSSGKQPYYFTSRDASLLAFAGLWEQAGHQPGHHDYGRSSALAPAEPKDMLPLGLAPGPGDSPLR